MADTKRRFHLGPVRLLFLALIAAGMIFAVKAAFPTPPAGNNTLLGTLRIVTGKPQAESPIHLRRSSPYQVLITPDCEVCFYVFVVTADRRVLALFPTSACTSENPLSNPTFLPAENSAFQIDGPPGRCWLIGLAAIRPLPDVPEVFDPHTRQALVRMPFDKIPSAILARTHDVLSSDLVPIQAVEFVVD